VHLSKEGGCCRATLSGDRHAVQQRDETTLCTNPHRWCLMEQELALSSPPDKPPAPQQPPRPAHAVGYPPNMTEASRLYTEITMSRYPLPARQSNNLSQVLVTLGSVLQTAAPQKSEE
jgi:hypothetical protein